MPATTDPSAPRRRRKRRLPAALLVAAVTLLAFEGAVSAAGRGSLLRSLPRLWNGGADADAVRPLSDEERRRAAAENPGIWRAHPDPRVGYVLRAHSDLAVGEGTIRSDGLGLRMRAGPPMPSDALRVAVLGASIPFGYGLDDDEVLAHRLELALTAARGPDARPILCRTVAMGRWNMRNAVAFLHDHMDELRPDLVLCMPFSNDLSDTDAVDESGHRRAAPDPAAPDPWLSVRSDSHSELIEMMKAVAAQLPRQVNSSQLGPISLVSDLSAESTRRYDENAAWLVRLHDELARRGARLAYLEYREDDHALHTLRRLLAAVPDLPVIPLLSDVPAEFALGDYTHPTARTVEVLADWVARELLERGLLERGTGPLPPAAPPEYEAHRAPQRTAGEIVELSRAARERAQRKLQPVIDFTNGRGVAQVYGGVSPSGCCGPRLLVVVARQGSALEVELAPLPDRPDLYPLNIAVEADGVRLGSVSLAAGSSTRAVFPLPPVDAPAVEARLLAPDWVVMYQRQLDTSEVVAFRPVRLSCENR